MQLVDLKILLTKILQRLAAVDGAVSVNNDITGQSLASGTAWVTITNGATLSLDSGTWLITGSIDYPSNSTGYRGIGFYVGTTGYTQSSIMVPAASGQVTRLSSALTVKLSSTSTVKIRGLQNSGSSQTVKTYLRAVRIA